MRRSEKTLSRKLRKCALLGTKLTKFVLLGTKTWAVCSLLCTVLFMGGPGFGPIILPFILWAVVIIVTGVQAAEATRIVFQGSEAAYSPDGLPPDAPGKWMVQDQAGPRENIMDIEQRLSRLEQRNRRLKWCIGGLVLVAVFLRLSDRVVPTTVPEVIQAKRFEVIGHNGEPAVVLNPEYFGIVQPPPREVTWAFKCMECRHEWIYTTEEFKEALGGMEGLLSPPDILIAMSGPFPKMPCPEDGQAAGEMMTKCPSCEKYYLYSDAVVGRGRNRREVCPHCKTDVVKFRSQLVSGMK